MEKSLNAFLLFASYAVMGLPWRTSFTTSIQLTGDVGEFPLLKLRLPEYWVGVREAMLHPSFFFDVVEIDEAARIGISMCGGENAPSAKLKSLFNLQVVAILRIEHSISECLTRSDAEKVSSKSSAVRVDIVQSRTFLRSDTSDHCSHR